MARMENEVTERADASPTNEQSDYGNYRKLGQPADTISGATQELFEVRPSGKSASGAPSDNSTIFKVIAVIAIVAILAAILATQFGVTF